MYARLYSARAKEGKMDEMIRVWSEEDIPLMGSVRGYRGACLLTDRESGRGISITLWDSEEDSEADERATSTRNSWACSRIYWRRSPFARDTRSVPVTGSLCKSG
jgi:heme-degrading monooxygenase HmoA